MANGKGKVDNDGNAISIGVARQTVNGESNASRPGTKLVTVRSFHFWSWKPFWKPFRVPFVCQIAEFSFNKCIAYVCCCYSLAN